MIGYWPAHRIRWIIRIACVAILLAVFALLALMFATWRGGRSALGTPDYAGFYVAATILNRGEPAHLYDQELQAVLYHRLIPAAPAGERYPYAHAPLVAFLLRPLAALPFRWSYAVWLTILAAVALAAFRVLWRTVEAIPPEDRATACLVGLSFLPLALECWLAGQLSVVGLFWVAVALRCLRAGLPVRTGVALSLCLYKPTMMLFTVPVLVLAGRWRIVGGFVAGALGLGGLTLAAVGWSGCRAFLGVLVSYSGTMARGSPGFKVFKHVDLNAFLHLLLGGPTPVARALWLGATVAAMAALAITWRSRLVRSDEQRALILGATITWNLVFNLYTPIYDVSVAIPGVLIAMDAHYRRPNPSEAPPGARFATLVALLVLGSWFTQVLARRLGFQILTPILFALGASQALLARRGTSAKPSGQGLPSA